MYCTRRLILVLLVLLISVGSGASFASARPVVESVRVGDQAKKTRFVVDLSAKVAFSVFTLADPYRVVIDLSEVDWRLKPEAFRPGKRITGFRFGLFRSGQSRMVLDVRRPVIVSKAFILGPNGNRGHRLVIDLAETSRAVFLETLRRPGPKSATDIGRSAHAPTLPAPTPRTRDSRPLIAIDPGHGGVDPGAQGRSGSWEKHITLLQARELKRQLLKTGRYRVLLTRDRDVFVRLRQRIAIAQRAQADLFISLHADSISNHRIRGGAVYTLSERASDKEAAALARKENKADIIAGIDLNDQSTTVAKILIDLRQRLTKNEAVTLAKGLVSELGKSMRLLRNNHRFAGFAVLKAPDIPSVLIEMGYLSNRTDERLLRQAKHRSRIARSIVRAIDVYFARQQALRQP
jgi:N-acetylmuramoyl-L-alanine amidase